MIIKDVTLMGHNYGDAEVWVGRYDTTKAIAIRLHDAQTGEPLTTATVNMPQAAPHEGCFWLKTWGENEGLLLLLGQAGLIEFEEKPRVIDVNAYGSQAVECKAKGELKDLIDKTAATWT